MLWKHEFKNNKKIEIKNPRESYYIFTVILFVDISPKSGNWKHDTCSKSFIQILTQNKTFI